MGKRKWPSLLACTLALSLGLLSYQASTAENEAKTDTEVSNAEQTGAPHKVAEESAEEFLHRYYAARADAKSEADLQKFLKTSKSSPAQAISQNKMAEAAGKLLFAPLIEMHLKGVPTSVRVVSRTALPGGAVKFELAPQKIPPYFAKQSTEKNFSMRGFATVEKVDNQWKINSDYWKVKTKDTPGTSELGFGFDPDDEYSKVEKPARTFAGFSKDFEGRYRDMLMDKPWSGAGEVHACFKVASDGRISDISAKDKNGRRAAEQYVKQVIAQTPLKEPVPAAYRDKPWVWMYFHWTGNSNSISGPYFDKTIPDWLAYEMKLKRRPFDLEINDRVMKTLEDQKSAGAARVFLKLKPTGAIEKIYVRTEPKNATAEKIAYDAVCKAHPFGALPQEFASTPYFELRLNWSTAGQSAMTQHLERAPQWLK